MMGFNFCGPRAFKALLGRPWIPSRPTLASCDGFSLECQNARAGLLTSDAAAQVYEYGSRRYSSNVFRRPRDRRNESIGAQKAGNAFRANTAACITTPVVQDRRFSTTLPALSVDVPENSNQELAASLLKTGKVVVALGSNMGDRLEHIETACRLIDSDPDMRIVSTSALYETEPMYVEEQDRFLNGVCEVATTLEPIQLLDRLQAIENQLGRVKIIDKGPRNIDLDVLLYRDAEIHTDRLTIPHPLMLEREFVLRPLRDLLDVGMASQRLESRLQQFEATAAQPMYTWTALSRGNENVVTGRQRRQTLIMSILNITPDSFSDGGLHDPRDVQTFTSMVRSQIAAGASILDVGGQSSRPNAPNITAAEEIARVMPAIEAIKSLPEAAGVAISIDTYRAAVAEAAVKAGAHIVNDISAGLLDPAMLPTVARLGCTYAMMHMRGTPATMMIAENCSYPDGLGITVAKELEDRVAAALAAGIRWWRIILDPGIGFSKTVPQNAQLLRELNHLTENEHSDLRGFGWLIGSSRKSFIGKITGVENPKERGWGTAATVTAAIAGGASIVRVHDAGEMAAVVKMADAIYRGA